MINEYHKLKDHDLVSTAKTLVRRERQCICELLLVIKEIKERQLFLRKGYQSLHSYCQKELGLSENQAWKRSQAVAAISIYPKFLDMLANGETYLSQLTMIAPHLNQENAEEISFQIKGRSKSEVAFYLSKFQGDQYDANAEETIEITITLNRGQYQSLKRAQDILSHSGKNTTESEAIAKALDLLLDRKDPMKKAERAEKRAQSVSKKPTSKLTKRPTAKTRSSRPAIPVGLRYQVFRRDGGQCTFVGEDGKRCDETRMLEIDHVDLWSRGGEHTLDNLRLLCRQHNQYLAAQVLGKDYLERFKR